MACAVEQRRDLAPDQGVVSRAEPHQEEVGQQPGDGEPETGPDGASRLGPEVAPIHPGPESEPGDEQHRSLVMRTGEPQQQRHQVGRPPGGRPPQGEPQQRRDERAV